MLPSICGVRSPLALRKTAIVACLAPCLIDTLASVFGMQVTHSKLVKIFFLDQRQVGIAFHLGHRLLTCYKLLSRTVVDFALINGAGLLLSTHLTHVGYLWHHHLLLRWVMVLVLHVVLPLCELPECILLGLHITVVGEVGVIRASLVL